MDPLWERERGRENNHVRKIPRAIYRLYDLFWPDCSEIFKARNIHVCFKTGSFLSFLKSRKTYSGRTFSLISLSFITPPKNKRITWHSLLHRRFYLFIRCFIDLWGGINQWLFTQYDVARGILKFQCKTWEFRATSYSVNNHRFITHAHVCGTWPGNRLSTRRNTQDNKFCL